MRHELKIWPEFFEAVIEERKPFELRNNDRGFAVDDYLWLREWDPQTRNYTGRETGRRVTYLLEHRPGADCAADYGLRSPYVILGTTYCGVFRARAVLLSDPLDQRPDEL